MAAACTDAEGWGPLSPNRPFDLTPCFEDGILLSTLLVVAVVAGAAEVGVLAKKERLERSGKSRTLLVGKEIILGLALLASLANVVLVFLTHPPQVTIPQSYILEAIALVSFLPLTYLNHYRARTSSTLLLLFWPAYLFCDLIWLRTTLALYPIRDTIGWNYKVTLALRCAVVLLGLVSFFLECISPEVGLTSPALDQENVPSDKKIHVENPLLTANVFSLWTFGWMTPLMKKGAKKFITEEDLPDLLKEDEAGKLGDDLQRALEKHKSLWLALFAAYGPPYLIAAFLKIVQDMLSFLQPQLLRLLLAYIARYQSAYGDGYGKAEMKPDKSGVEGFAIAGVMFVAALVQTVFLHQYFQRVFTTGAHVRSGLITLLYQKALRLSSAARGERSSGDVVNLMSVDTTRLMDLCTYGLIVVSGPLQITLAFISLYSLLGWSAFVGVAIMALSIPLNTWIARLLKSLQQRQMRVRDKRTKLMTELINNIRSVKLYAWEGVWVKRVLGVRNDEEMKLMRKAGILTAGNMALWSGIPLLVAFSSFATASYVSSKPLTSDVIFPAISLFMLLQFPLAMFAQVTTNVIEAVVSVKRLSEFLKAEELQTDARTVVEGKALNLGDEVLTIRDGEFVWSSTATNPTLEGINLSVKKGELLGVLGRVGAGKTSLLSAIAGDMQRVEGEVTLYGSVSYAPQNPWIMSSTLRENILFSHVYDEAFYNLVLDACALRQDLALMPQGDLTEVGEKGITLSGGQRARVSLARAVYARADLVLLDDVLAAIDSHVARHVFDQVIGPYGILSTKARILVTNSVAFLRQFDQLVFIRRGIIVESGSYESLTSGSETQLGKLVRGHSAGLSSGSSTPFSNGTQTPRSEDDRTLAPSSTSESPDNIERAADKLCRRQSFGKAKLTPVTAMQASADGPTKEHSEQGQVKKEVYLKYISAASSLGFSLFLLACILQQALSVAANLTLRSWGEYNRQTGGGSSRFSRYIVFYGLFSLFSTLIGGAAAVLLWVLCALRSARRMHDQMLFAVIRAPLTFFELTPAGRILNLFSRDTYVVDQVLARVIQAMVRTLCSCAGILIVIGVSFPAFLIAVPFLGYFYIRVMIYYLATSRELKRLDAVTRSPIFAWFSESLGGISTIRAFGQQAIFVAKNEYRVDRNQTCYLPAISVNRWLAIRLEFVGASIIFIAAILAMVALVTTGVDAGLVGLVLSYALNTTGALNWVVRSASEVEQNIVSVERILNFTQLPSEAPYEIADAKPETEWPSEGKVEFVDYSTRYRPELDFVLKNISISVNPREKIGICGRTGSGKSSLLLSLFRIIEPSSGTILIDGVDVTKIGLYDLRSAISIVPQSPDLFEGTLRENVDPVGMHEDAEIWVALSQAHLKEYVESLPEKLDAQVAEGGSSLSAGQRQLICFARAMLRKTKILVLDEATSAVDLDTDRAIQEIIRGPQFADVTMFTIAHRLNTILESDRVLVLDAGKVVEFDTPKALLAEKDTVFYSLAAEAGLA